MNGFALRLGSILVLTVLSAVAASSASAGNFSPNVSISGPGQGSTQSLNPGGRPTGGHYGYGSGGVAPPPATSPKRPFHFFNPNTQFSGPGYNNNSTNGLAVKGFK